MPRSRPPKGFDYISPTLEALEAELRSQVSSSHEGLRKTEAMWPVMQINNQRTRYVYDMYKVHKKISREVYDFCIREKIIDAALISKWKKQGYENLCSTYVINPSNYKFGSVSICRVPRSERREKGEIQDPNTGCTGCCSGDVKGGNVFGNRYGQRLAGIQIGREERRKRKEEEQRAREEEEKAAEEAKGGGDGDSETDDSDSESDDDFGPAPVKKPVGSVFGNKEEEKEALKLTEGAEDEEDEEEGPSKKKAKAS
ncbi:hypothetical protein TrCOL_g1855 [Triparma columacea]|uniref:G10 protein n=1 Tax=Triparma columacea TaxID=722753 RepID=A0A9W7L4G4_9STRA|nr:hypothetical protein TrCOL_g1855 [Triparma columacea]